MERFLPMLAVQSQPFDSAEHLFEVKWDGVRAVAAVEAGHWNVWGRELADYTQRYPELDVLRRLPAGTVLDGELVLLRSGRADLQELMRRHQLAGARKIQEASRRLPATYMVFDLVYHGGRPLWGRPLAERRLLLAELLDQYPGHGLVLSEGVAGSGRTFFDKVVEQGHEGVMAKHLQSRYLPGRRVQAWRKIKPFQSIPCVVIGYTPSREGIHSLLVAATSQGVAAVRGGVDQRFFPGAAVAIGSARTDQTAPEARGPVWQETGHLGRAGDFLRSAVPGVDTAWPPARSPLSRPSGPMIRITWLHQHLQEEPSCLSDLTLQSS